MKSKQAKFVLVVIVIILLVIGIGVFSNKSQGVGKLDGLAKALTASGTKFYGAFWCSHCQAQKAEFGSSKKYLPYVECSNPDQSVMQVCKDAKIESYPTWIYGNGITLSSKGEPIVCGIKPAKPEENPVCEGASSQYYKTWIFPEYQFSIKSPADPVVKSSVWTFPVGAETTGEIPLEFLAAQIGFTLPVEAR